MLPNLDQQSKIGGRTRPRIGRDLGDAVITSKPIFFPRKGARAVKVHRPAAHRLHGHAALAGGLRVGAGVARVLVCAGGGIVGAVGASGQGRRGNSGTAGLIVHLARDPLHFMAFSNTHIKQNGMGFFVFSHPKCGRNKISFFDIGKADSI